MKSYTLKNIPDTTYARLKESAQKNRRTLNNEILMLLDRFAPRRKEEIEQEMKDMEAFHKKLARKSRVPALAEIVADVREGRK